MMVDNKESFTDSEEEMVDVTDENETLNVNVTKRYNFSKRSKRYTAYRRTRQDAKKRKEKQYSTPEGHKKHMESDRNSKADIRLTSKGRENKGRYTFNFKRSWK